MLCLPSEWCAVMQDVPPELSMFATDARGAAPWVAAVIRTSEGAAPKELLEVRHDLCVHHHCSCILNGVSIMSLYAECSCASVSAVACHDIGVCSSKRGNCYRLVASVSCLDGCLLLCHGPMPGSDAMARVQGCHCSDTPSAAGGRQFCCCGNLKVLQVSYRRPGLPV